MLHDDNNYVYITKGHDVTDRYNIQVSVMQIRWFQPTATLDLNVAPPPMSDQHSLCEIAIKIACSRMGNIATE